MKELKELEPDWDGDSRRNETNRLWKVRISLPPSPSSRPRPGCGR